MKLCKISLRYIEKQRLLSCFAVITIAISVTMLYIYSVVQNGVIGLQEHQIVRTMGSYHVRFSDLNDEQSNALYSDDRIEQCGEVANIGMGEKNEQKFVFVGLDEISFSLTGMKLLSGHIPEAENEIILEERMLDRLGILHLVPQSIEFTVTDFDGNNSQKKEYYLTGILENHVTGELAPRGWGYADKDSGWNDFLVKIVDCDNIYEIINSIANDYGIETEMISYNESLLSVSGEKIDIVANNGLSYIMIIIIVSSCTLIISMYGISINMRQKQFKVLKYAGATKKQIDFIVLSEGLILSGIGCVLGIVIAVTSKNTFIHIIGKTINPEALYMNTSSELIEMLTFYTKLSWKSLLFASILGIGMTLLSIWLIIGKMTKSSSKSFKRINRKKTHRKYKETKNIIFYIAKNNLYRNKWGTYFTIVTMVIAFIVSLCVSLFTKTIRPNDAVLKMMDSDFSLSTEMPYIMPNDLLEYLTAEEIEQIAGMNGVERVKVRYSIVNIPDNEEQVHYLVSYDEKTMERIIEESGLSSLQMSNEQICVGRSGANDNIYSDSSMINSIININNMDFRIAAVTNVRDILGKEMLEPDIIVNFEWYQQITGRSDANRIDIYMSDNATEDDLEKINLAMKQLQKRHPVMKYYDYVEVKAKLEEAARSTKEMAYTIVIVLSIIGLMGIANTLLTSIYRRTAEIATFRIGGMTRYQTICMMLSESVQYGLKTLIYGIPLGSAISLWFSYNMIHEILIWDLMKQIALSSIVLIGMCIVFSIPAVAQITNKDMLSFVKEE